MRVGNHLIGVDRRGGKSYQEIACEVCGGYFFVGGEAESGICARCVVMGYPRSKTEINIQDLSKAIEEKSLKRYRKENKLSQDAIAKFLGISRMHYRRIEDGKPIGRSIARKIEKKLAQAEQSQ